MIRLDTNKVQIFAKRLLAEVDGRIIISKDQPSFELVSNFLDWMNIANKDQFLKKTSITYKNYIVTPYIPGISNKYWSLRSQVTNLAHECVHVLQYRSNPNFLAEYALILNNRTNYEIEAMKPEIELYYHLAGKPINISKLLNRLSYYNLKEKNLKYASRALYTYSRVTRGGKLVGSAIGKKAIKILNSL